MEAAMNSTMEAALDPSLNRDEMSLCCHRLSDDSSTARRGGGSTALDILGMALEVPDTGRRPIDLCVALDISGSMGGEAVLGKEGSGLTLLDVSKHGVRTVLHTVCAEDRVAIVTFSHQTTTVRSLSRVSDASADAAFLDDISATGGTNIAHALQTAQSILSQSRPEATSCCFLLTDGETSDKSECLRLVNAASDSKKPLVCCFGVGYDIDSELLTALAIKTGGFFTFVPDAGFIGTAFVQGMATVLTVALENCTFIAEEDEGANTASWEAGGSLQAQGERCVYGTIYANSTTFAVMSTERQRAGAEAEAPCVAVTGYSAGGGATVQISAEAETVPGSATARWAAERARIRTFAGILNTGGNAIAQKKLVCQGIEAIKVASAEAVALRDKVTQGECEGILFDLEGEITKALAPDMYRKWGRHYLASLSFSHLFRLTLNFKDVGIQGYMKGSALRIRDEADAIFNTLPEPTSSLRRRHFGASTSYLAAPATPIRMASLNDSDNICIDARTCARTRNGIRPLSSIRADDEVWALLEQQRGYTTGFAKVRATVLQHGVLACLVAPHAPLSRCLVTAGHPCVLLDAALSGRKSDSWRSVRSGGPHISQQKADLVSLVLEPACARGVVLFEGESEGGAVVAASLGHGMLDVSTYGLAAHHFLGHRESVLCDLARCAGFPNVWAVSAIRNECGHVHAIAAA